MKVLLHVCCACCTPYPLKVLSEEGHQVSGFWYNPNIHPFTEYQNRLNAVKTFESLKSFPVFYNDSYDLEKYLKAVINDVENRCRYCYKIRLIKTANWAIQEGFDGFSTTLLVSPHQKHELVKEIGGKIGKDLGIGFVYRDFRPGFYEGKNEAKKLDLYSQKYCGCIFSEKERYLNKSQMETFKKFATEDCFDTYNQRIKSMLNDTKIKDRSHRVRGSAGRFKKNSIGKWEPVDHPGYTIITPIFEDELDNIKTYVRLGEIQQILLERLTLSKYVPAPVTSFHLTIADLVAGRTWQEGLKGTREQKLLQALSLLFNQLTLQGPIRMQVQGISVFSAGFIVALVAAADKSGYDRLISFRNSIYEDERLRNFGIERKFPFFTGHITLAYIEETLTEQDQNLLAKTLIVINRQSFTHSLFLNVVRAEVRRFDTMERFYRHVEWPVFEFV